MLEKNALIVTDIFGWQHRLFLTRVWNDDKPIVCFIGLNPSTANEHDNDATINRLIGFADYNGYGGIYMLNLFTLVTSKPDELVNEAYHNLYPNWRKYFIEAQQKCDAFVFMYGDIARKTKEHGKERIEWMRKHISQPKCFKVTQRGYPIHPLYLPKGTKFIPYAAN